jgi:DNA-directed RNA polymerase subunit K/omega
MPIKKKIKKEDSEDDDNDDDDYEDNLISESTSLSDNDDEIDDYIDEINENNDDNKDDDDDNDDNIIDYNDNNEYIDNPYKNTKGTNEYEILSKENRISSNRMTKYEMVRILGERTKQLSMGAKPLIKNYNGLSYDIIAEEEFKLNMIPFKIQRTLPNGKLEIWSLDELNHEHLLSQL